MKTLIEKYKDRLDYSTDLKKVFDKYGEINKVYLETLRAMGLKSKTHSVVKNSSEITLTTSNDSSNIFIKFD